MNTYVLDCECYVNYFLILAKHVGTGEVVRVTSRDWFNGKTVVTFNGNGYDIPLISMAFNGADLATLKKASDRIIVGGLKPWEVEREFGFERMVIDHIDLIEVSPGIAGLKTYGGRLHSRKLQDLPIAPDATLTFDQMRQIELYCANDLQTTVDLYNKLKPQIDLRVSMSAEYGIDLRSKSDAQIAEAVIRKEVERLKGHRVYRPELDPNYTFKYKAPEFVRFLSAGMRKVLDIVTSSGFTLGGEGQVLLPRVLESMHIRIGRGVYRMGIGGLHSSESSVSYKSHATKRIVDRDVTSYYPSIILTQGLYPTHLGTEFLQVYQGLVDRRIEAKRKGDSVTADALKICVNGSFGKLGSMWSVLYSPDLLIAVTLTGQLSLLMLIEALDAVGIEVVSANTDGVVSVVRADQEDLFAAVVHNWEVVTQLNTEETQYEALYSKDVNNYIAVKADGTVKTKGLYATDGLAKNPTCSVCVDAVIAYVTKGTPVEATIRACTDMTKFVTVRQVKGGAVFCGTPIGKTVRWYYADSGTHIAYLTNGNKVPKSEGAKPLMELGGLMTDIDYDWYVNEANAMLQVIGA